MAGRFPAARLTGERRAVVRCFPLKGVLAAAVLLAACAQGTPTAGTGQSAELARQAQAMQRTVLEATATGALLGAAGTALFGDGDRDDVVRGALIGAATGAAAGTYVAYLQRQYASNEDRLERLRADIERTNAETETAIRNMRAVLEQNRRQLAAVRAADPGSLPAAEAAAGRDLANMRLVVAGAERRLDEFNSTRALQLVPGQGTGVDAQIDDLGRRIAEMRAITDTLAEEILMRPWLLATLLAAGCVQSDDPAEGGFYSGVAGLAGGGYEARIAEREAAVATAQSRQAALASELAALEREHRALQQRIGAQRSLLRRQGVALPPATELRIDAALAGPSEIDPAARAAALERAVADARRLSEQLAALAG